MSGRTVWLVWWAFASGASDHYLEAIVETRAEANRVQRRFRDKWKRTPTPDGGPRSAIATYTVEWVVGVRGGRRRRGRK